MSKKSLRGAADLFLSVAQQHPEYDAHGVDSETADEVRFWIDLRVVEMPHTWRKAGVSPTGVRTVERIFFTLDKDYPWSVPKFHLRQDFNRALPHIQSGSIHAPPVPCIVDGPIREFMCNAGSHEAGIWQLIEQLVVWLTKAAKNSLIDPKQGWEPVRRDVGLVVLLTADLDQLRIFASQPGEITWLDARGVRPSDPDFLNKFVGCDLGPDRIEVDVKRHKTLFDSATTPYSGAMIFHTAGAIVAPELMPGGKQFIANKYFPETVETLGDLKDRARDLHSLNPLLRLLQKLEDTTKGVNRDEPVILPIVLAARRPFDVIDEGSAIELLPYAVKLELKPNRTSVFPEGDKTRVVASALYRAMTPALLRRVSNTAVLDPVSFIGCGSVGSKIAVHLAKAGVPITALADKEHMAPHNFARHALFPTTKGNKAELLADEVKKFVGKPHVETGDLSSRLKDQAVRAALFGKPTTLSILTAGSLELREILSSIPHPDIRVPVAEIALFGRGRGGFMLVEGAQRNPNISDLTAELYGSVKYGELRDLMFDPKHGFTAVQVGQGCGSFTLPMSDARLSLVTAGMSEEILRVLKNGARGEVITAISELDSPSTRWTRSPVEPFHIVPIEGSPGWSFRVSARILTELRRERFIWRGYETGGVIVGVSSQRTKTVTVIDHLPAPSDSIRRPSKFILGRKGLKRAIHLRFERSGGTVFDVGTWHSHPDDSGPSHTDRTTAAQLAIERPPPSALLIVGETRCYGVMKRTHV